MEIMINYFTNRKDNKMKRIIYTAAMLAVLLSVSLLAQKTNSEKVRITTSSSQFGHRAINDLIRGIESDNAGLRKSSIYMAGYYKVNQSAAALIKRLKVEEDANTRILIALSLFRLGDEEGLETVKKLSIHDSSPKVRRISFAILKEAAGANSLYSVINELK